MTEEEQQQQQQLAALQLGLQQALEAQSMMASLTSRCFNKCVDKPAFRRHAEPRLAAAAGGRRPRRVS
ncbi:hypothetical protein Emag_004237 [Eimeria magna]